MWNIKGRYKGVKVKRNRHSKRFKLQMTTPTDTLRKKLAEVPLCYQPEGPRFDEKLRNKLIQSIVCGITQLDNFCIPWCDYVLNQGDYAATPKFSIDRLEYHLLLPESLRVDFQKALLEDSYHGAIIDSNGNYFSEEVLIDHGFYSEYPTIRLLLTVYWREAAKLWVKKCKSN